MKTFFLIPLMFCLPFLSAAQYNFPQETEEGYCSHLKSSYHYQKPYYFSPTGNEFLNDYDVHFYFLDISAENNTVYISGDVTITASVTAAVMDTFAFELIDEMVVDGVLINGEAHSFEHTGDMGLVPLQAPLIQGEVVTARISYHGTPPSGDFFTGISTAYDSIWGRHVTWTLSEPYSARDWFPVKQDLADKADSVWVFVTTSAENMVGSQGLLTNVTAMPGGKVRYEWKSRYPICYYLISIAVADYQDYSIYAHPANRDDSVLVQNFIYDDPACLNQWKGAIDQTTAFIELFSEIYGPYPFSEEKYGHCLALIGGGMEHQTMTTLGGFNFGLVAHELAHMWFGDHVTCATWNDIWINEGFATYSDYLAHHFLASPFYDSLWLKIRHDHVKTKPGGSVYVPDSLLDDVWRIFDGRLSYSKGALLLHMIRFELQDDELFFDILSTFQERHSFSVAGTADFKSLLEELSGMDFTIFFNQWYYGEGYPVFDVAWAQHSDTLSVVSTQTSSSEATPLFVMHVPYLVDFSDGSDTMLILLQDGHVNTYRIGLDRVVSGIRVDPGQWVLHKLNSLTMGLEEPGHTISFSLGPNPTAGHVHLFLTDRPGRECHLTLCDLSGRAIMEDAVFPGEHIVDISGLQPGIYLISVTDGLGVYTRRLMKL